MALRACSRLGSRVRGLGRQPGECGVSSVNGVSRWEWGQLAPELRKPRRATHSASPLAPDFKHCRTWHPSLLHNPRLRVFSIPKSAAPRDRQRNLPMAGRKASTLCSPATLSQCALASPESRLPCRAPPSGNTGMNPICRHLVCGTGIFLGRFSSYSNLSSHTAGFLVRQPNATVIRRVSPTVFR